MSSSQIQAVKDERQADREFEEEMQLLKNLAAQRDSPEKIRNDFVQDIKESPLDEPSGEVLKNLLSPDFIFAYYSGDEVQELKHMLRLKKRQYLEMHPARECLVTGSDRAYANDDPSDTLTPLSDAEYLAVDSLFRGIYARVTRAKEMKQVELLVTSINENRLNRDSDDGGGGGGGLMGYLKGG